MKEASFLPPDQFSLPWDYSDKCESLFHFLRYMKAGKVLFWPALLESTMLVGAEKPPIYEDGIYVFLARSVYRSLT